jgi:hypothetical protein
MNNFKNKKIIIKKEQEVKGISSRTMSKKNKKKQGNRKIRLTLL